MLVWQGSTLQPLLGLGLFFSSLHCTQSVGLLWESTYRKSNNYTQTMWPLVRKRNIPTGRPPLIGEMLVPTFADRGVSRGQRVESPRSLIFSFIDRSRYFSFK
jgi:hypothetical protein